MDNSENFVQLLKNGTLRKHILKNSSPDYTKVREEYDLQGYIRFVNSRRMDILMDCEVNPYCGDEQV